MLPHAEHPKNSIRSLVIKCEKDSVQLTVGRKEDNTVRPEAVPGTEGMRATSSSTSCRLPRLQTSRQEVHPLLTVDRRHSRDGKAWRCAMGRTMRITKGLDWSAETLKFVKL